MGKSRTLHRRSGTVLLTAISFGLIGWGTNQLFGLKGAAGLGIGFVLGSMWGFSPGFKLGLKVGRSNAVSEWVEHGCTAHPKRASEPGS